MAVPNSRDSLIEYALRRLGKPVIEINVDCEQLEDRLDEALKMWQEFHMDATEKVYEPYQITADDITNKYITFDSSTYINITQILPENNVGGSGMFNLEYQLRLQDYTAFGSATWGDNITGYKMYHQHLSLLQEVLVGVAPIRFTRHMNKLNIDWDWETDVSVDDYIVVEAFKIVDPTSYTKVYGDLWLKEYVTELVREQWGQNLSKFAGIQLPGGVTLDGPSIKQEAQQNLERLRQELKDSYTLPTDFYMG
jgi:hypothetical protein